MHAIQLLQEYFQKSLPEIHVKRKQRLLMLVESLLARARLTLTSLGRHTIGPAYVKNKIKAVDRLLGNKKLSKERIEIYKYAANKLIGGLTKIDIIVDWSPAGNHENHILRASLLLDDRSMTLYEEVYPQRLLNNYKIHKKFLDDLEYILPDNVMPTIITDAGFRVNWFKLVLLHGWDFLGRVCNMHYELCDGVSKRLSSLYARAMHIPGRIGRMLLSKRHKLPCEAYIYRGEKSSMLKSYKRRETNFAKEIARYRKQHKEPWIIVTSEGRLNKNPKKIINTYKRRMKIEHEFRNMKNSQWGLGLNETKTRNPERLSIMLLIAAIAMFILWLIGKMGEHKLMHYHYQVNSVKKHRVVSLIFLGSQIIEHEPESILSFKFDKLLDKICKNENFLWQQ